MFLVKIFYDCKVNKSAFIKITCSIHTLEGYWVDLCPVKTCT